ncbi:MerR family transcriptional regulator [bacterium]|nr:MAG: MerR family transcriptional regulator [bacterium]
MKNDIKKLYYSIGEVSKMVGLKSYVLRYWETEFKQLSPPKNRAGNRTYRQKDIDLIFKIKDLLHGKKFTIEGARSFVSGKSVTDLPTEQINKNIIRQLKNELNEILQIINK